jgi:hypothetical protein
LIPWDSLGFYVSTEKRVLGVKNAKSVIFEFAFGTRMHRN